MGHQGRHPDVPRRHVIVFPASRRASRRRGMRLVMGLCIAAMLIPGVFLVNAAHNRIQQMVLAFCWLAFVYLIGRVLWLWIQWNEHVPRGTDRLHTSHRVRPLGTGTQVPELKLPGPASDSTTDE